MRNARYGLRGVRVGEPSNPGPPQSRIRPRVGMVEDILASLEHDLTHIDSDDEPLVVGSARNVVPRFFRHSPASVIEDVGIKSIALDSFSCVVVAFTLHPVPSRLSFVGERWKILKTPAVQNPCDVDAVIFSWTILLRSQVYLLVTVVVLQKWWSSVNGDQEIAFAVTTVSARWGRALLVRNVTRTRCSGIHGGQFQ